jgi:HSP20 family protein
MVYRYSFARHPLTQFRDEMDRVLSGFFGRYPSGTTVMAGRGQPPINLWERGDALYAEAEVPGVKPDQVEVSVVGDELTLTVRREDATQDGIAYHRRERGIGSFTRVVRIPVEVDAGRVEAALRDGVLTVTLPKAESAKPRKIPVASA